MKGHVIGADGGNTKTHYALFDENGQMISFAGMGTASHERFAGGFDDAKKALESGIKKLLEGTGIKLKDISYGVFGLAGADNNTQIAELTKRIEDIGIKNVMVCNDAYLGIKAGTKKGYGVCSINGTATSCAAIDKSGRTIQVGGTGYFYGDEAGGSFIEGMVVRKVYDSCFRCAEETIMKQKLFDTLGINDDELFVNACETQIFSKTSQRGRLCYIAFEAANKGDKAAVDILKSCGTQLARSAAGAVSRLDFENDDKIEVVMAGSVYVKAENPILKETFIQQTQKYLNNRAEFALLGIPPVSGAVIWALDNAGFNKSQQIRSNVIECFEKGVW